MGAKEVARLVKIETASRLRLYGIRGEWLQTLGYDRFTVLGHSAQLIDMDLDPSDRSVQILAHCGQPFRRIADSVPVIADSF
jgi:hypothetical protein